MPPMPPGPPSGPDLTSVGVDRTKDWLSEQIRVPNKHKVASKMPVYPADKISDTDLAQLVSYLASQKPDVPKEGGGPKKDIPTPMNKGGRP